MPTLGAIVSWSHTASHGWLHCAEGCVHFCGTFPATWHTSCPQVGVFLAVLQEHWQLLAKSGSLRETEDGVVAGVRQLCMRHLQTTHVSFLFGCQSVEVAHFNNRVCGWLCVAVQHTC